MGKLSSGESVQTKRKFVIRFFVPFVLFVAYVPSRSRALALARSSGDVAGLS